MLFVYKLKDPTAAVTPVTFIGNKIITRSGSLITTDLQVTVDLTHYGLLESVRDEYIRVEDIILPGVETLIGFDEEGNVRYKPFFLDLDIDDPEPLPLEEYKAMLRAYSTFLSYLEPA